jgi:hypothetical protein
MIAHREKPLGLALLLGVLGRGELVEAIGEDEAAVRCERAPFRLEVVDRAPLPPPLRTIGAVSLILMSSRAATLGVPSGNLILILRSAKSSVIVAMSTSRR